MDWSHWRHWTVVHARWWSADAVLLLRRTGAEFSEDRCPQLAASISYFVLFSIFPLVIVVVSISGLVLTDDQLRQDVIDELFNILPLSEEEGRGDLENAIDSVATGFSAIGLVSIMGLFWSASGMMGAIRHGLNEAWDTTSRRPFLRAKFLDILLVLATGVLIGLSIGSTIFLQVARRVSSDLSDLLGPLGEGTSFGFEAGALFVPMLLSFLTFMFLFKVVPDVNIRFRHIWPGALLAAVLFEVVKNGFAIYLRYFGDYDAIYGSLGAVVAFLFFVYVSANVLLLGAEMAAEWPRVIHGHYDAKLAEAPATPSKPLYRKIQQLLVGLIRRETEIPEHIPDPSAQAARTQRRSDEIAGRRSLQAPPPVDEPPSDQPD